jgi:hypothetical protein
MDSLFIAACQGLGLALAAGLLFGAAGRTDQLGAVLALAAAVAGAVLFAQSLDANGHSSWPGYPIGLVVALLSYVVGRDVTAGAAKRAKGSPLAVSGLVAVVALVLAGLSLPSRRWRSRRSSGPSTSPRPGGARRLASTRA